MSQTSSFRLPDELGKRLDRFVRQSKRRKNWVIVHELEDYLDRHEACSAAAEARRQSLLTTDLAFPFSHQGRPPETSYFTARSPSPPVPLSTRHPRCHHRRGMTRGQRGSLLLHCGAPSSPTLCRFIPALSAPPLWAPFGLSATTVRLTTFRSPLTLRRDRRAGEAASKTSTPPTPVKGAGRLCQPGRPSGPPRFPVQSRSA